MNTVQKPASQEGSPRLVSVPRWARCSWVSRQLHQQGIREASDSCPTVKAAPSLPFGFLGPERRQAPLLAGASVSIWRVSLCIFCSLRHQPHSALLSAARRTGMPAGRIPSRRGLLPSEGRKAPLCLRDWTCAAAFLGLVPAEPLEYSGVRPPGLQFESLGGPSVAPTGAGRGPSTSLAILISLLGSGHQLPWPQAAQQHPELC